MSDRRRHLPILFVGLLTSLVAILAPASAAPAATRPFLFRAGAAVADLTPPPGVPVYSGGFGQSPPIYGDQQLRDNGLNARAIYVSNGKHAVTLVTVDSQGLFAAVQQVSRDPRTSGLGSVGMRADAARDITRGHVGPPMTAADIIVQGTHSHSAPTAMGLWGPVDDRYLQLLHDRVVEAIVGAARSARPAHLQYASIDAPYLDNVNTNQTDSYQGWLQDGQVSVLRAISARDGSTIATYANVPAHPDIVNGAGIAQGCIDHKVPTAQCPALSADYFGRTRKLLEDQLGGTGIVAGATLGREETPIQVGGIDRMNNYGRLVTELLTRALATPRWITDGTVASHETFLSIPGTNPALLALVLAWSGPGALGRPVTDQVSYPADRADTPPYQTGNVIGTPVTSLRIGRLAYVTLNGEAFPEVRQTIARGVKDADMVVGLSLGNDQLGYYEPAHAFVFANGVAPYHSDHLQYNISPVFGDQEIQTQVHNLSAVGFHTNAFVLSTPGHHDWVAAAHPGLQALAYPARGDADPVTGTFVTTLEGIFGNAALLDSANRGAGPAGPVRWDLGDGTRLDTPVSGRYTSRFTHAYRPGTYNVHLKVTDTNGDTAQWDVPITVYAPLHPVIRSRRGPHGSTTYDGSFEGGSGQVLLWKWRFGDGTVAYGRVVTHRDAPGVTGTQPVLTIVDGTGTVTSMQPR
ncbi:MAG: PKD domain-containing protein [Candidatus Dormibacteraeota bacterium]|nr:PKD domain-containing protein [Candidatus Dormibacteraeota bacterium]